MQKNTSDIVLNLHLRSCTHLFVKVSGRPILQPGDQGAFHVFVTPKINLTSLFPCQPTFFVYKFTPS